MPKVDLQSLYNGVPVELNHRVYVTRNMLHNQMTLCQPMQTSVIVVVQTETTLHFAAMMMFS
jgi:hypothetical protein